MPVSPNSFGTKLAPNQMRDDSGLFSETFEGFSRAEAMGKLPEIELVVIAELVEGIVGLMQMQHVDAAPILETGPIDATPGEPKALEPPGGGEPGR